MNRIYNTSMEVYRVGPMLCVHLPVERATSVAFMHAFRVGGGVEAGGGGHAHFVEHCGFKGSDKFSETDVPRAFAMFGARYNAFTTSEMTVFHSRVAPENLEGVIAIHAEMAENMKIRPEYIESEKLAVLAEMERNLGNVWRILNDEAVFVSQGGGMEGSRTSGIMQSVLGTTTDSLTNFYDKYYNGSNSIIMVVGAVPPDTRRMIEDRYGSFRVGMPYNPDQQYKTYQADRLRTTTIWAETTRPAVMMYVRVPGTSATREELCMKADTSEADRATTAILLPEMAMHALTTRGVGLLDRACARICNGMSGQLEVRRGDSVAMIAFEPNDPDAATQGADDMLSLYHELCENIDGCLPLVANACEAYDAVRNQRMSEMRSNTKLEDYGTLFLEQILAHNDMYQFAETGPCMSYDECNGLCDRIHGTPTSMITPEQVMWYIMEYLHPSILNCSVAWPRDKAPVSLKRYIDHERRQYEEVRESMRPHRTAVIAPPLVTADRAVQSVLPAPVVPDYHFPATGSIVAKGRTSDNRLAVIPVGYAEVEGSQYVVRMRFRDALERDQSPDTAIMQVGIFTRITQCPAEDPEQYCGQNGIALEYDHKGFTLTGCEPSKLFEGVRKCLVALCQNMVIQNKDLVDFKAAANNYIEHLNEAPLDRTIQYYLSQDGSSPSSTRQLLAISTASAEYFKAAYLNAMRPDNIVFAVAGPNACAFAEQLSPIVNNNLIPIQDPRAYTDVAGMTLEERVEEAIRSVSKPVAELTRKCVSASVPKRFIGSSQRFFNGKMHYLESPNSDAAVAMLRRTPMLPTDRKFPYVRLASQIAFAIFVGPFYMERLQNGLFYSLSGQLGCGANKRRAYDVIATQMVPSRVEEGITKFTALIRRMAQGDPEIFTESALQMAKMSMLSSIGSIDAKDAVDYGIAEVDGTGYDMRAYRDQLVNARLKEVRAAIMEYLGDESQWDTVYCGSTQLSGSYAALPQQSQLAMAAKAVFMADREMVGRAANHHQLKACTHDAQGACCARDRTYHV